MQITKEQTITTTIDLLPQTCYRETFAGNIEGYVLIYADYLINIRNGVIMKLNNSPFLGQVFPLEPCAWEEGQAALRVELSKFEEEIG